MLLVYCLSWWYGRGWKWRLDRGLANIGFWADYFSVDMLLKTLFSPYRQTFAARAEAGGSTMMQAAMDNAVSRFIGFFVRLFIIIAACFTLLFFLVMTMVLVMLWPLIPLLPLVSIILILVGGKF